MKTSFEGIKLIKKYEGCKLTAYLCPSKIWTIGWGNTFYQNGSKIKKGDKITQEQADELFLTLLPKYESIVKKNIKVTLTQNQFDALVSFCWNCGFSRTLFGMINNKKPITDIINWWSTHYITGGGKTLPGLVKRRKEESLLFGINYN